MGNMVTNVRAKFNYDQFHNDKALGNFQKSDNSQNNNKNKNMKKNSVRKAWGPVLGPKT